MQLVKVIDYRFQKWLIVDHKESCFEMHIWATVIIQVPEHKNVSILMKYKD